MGRFGERVGTLEAFAFATLLTALIGAVVLLVGRGEPQRLRRGGARSRYGCGAPLR